MVHKIPTVAQMNATPTEGSWPTIALIAINGGYAGVVGDGLISVPCSRVLTHLTA
jgi:hypothetical protein